MPDTTNGTAASITGRQDRVIDALLEGLTVVAAAKKTGVARRTVTGWLADPGFQERLAARKAAVAERVETEVAEVARLALTTVRDYLAADYVGRGHYGDNGKPWNQAKKHQVDIATKLLGSLGVLDVPKAETSADTQNCPD